MLKRIGLVAAMLVACGTESGSVGATPPIFPNGGAIPITDLEEGTDSVKVVVKAAQVVYEPVFVDDGGDGASVPCKADADCSAYQGASCHNNLCSTSYSVYGVFYVTNFPKGARSTISLPCDGRDYTAEVYGAATGNPYSIKESWSSAKITPPVSDTACSIATPSWTSITTPSFTFPTIYVGLPAPYDRYTVGVQDLQYPWAANNWSSTCDGVNPITTGPTGATFASPTVAGPFTCQALFYLDRSILVSGETAWALTYISPAQTPVPSGGAGLP